MPVEARDIKIAALTGFCIGLASLIIRVASKKPTTTAQEWKGK